MSNAMEWNPADWHIPNLNPFSVQLAAQNHSRGKRGFLFLMEVGLGKTAVTLNEFLFYKSLGLVEKLIIVCPNSLKGNWKEEISNYGLDLDLAVWEGKLPEYIKDGFIINYEAVAKEKSPGRGGEIMMNLLGNFRCYIAFDEVHRLKNPSSNVTKFVLKNVIDKPIIIRGLTGTPIGNSVLDIYSLLRLVGGLEGMNATCFKNRYCKMGGFLNKQVIGFADGKELEMQKLINAYSFRATKKQWLDLPEKLYKTVKIPMDDKLKVHYKKMEKDFVVMLEDRDISVNLAISKMQKLAQISSGFILDDKKEVNELVVFKETNKFKALIEILEGIDTKVIIFAHYNNTVDKLIKHLKGKVCYIRGGMEPDEITEMTELFNKSDEYKYIVMQSKTTEGLTLLGTRNYPCNTSIYYENTFSAIVRDQTEGRNHRIGQIKNVLYIDLVSSPLEFKIINSLQKKKNLSETLFDMRKELEHD